jgi:predicted small secreted protein
MRSYIIILAFAVMTLVTVSCNTVEGAGKDMQSGGRAVSDEARENK